MSNNTKYVRDAFKSLDLLEDTDFELTDKDSFEELGDFIETEDDDIREIEVMDTGAESEEDLQDSYIGFTILKCPVCRNLSLEDTEVVKDAMKDVDKDNELCCVGKACQVCGQEDGFNIVGKVDEFEPEREETEVEVETEPDEAEVEVKEKVKEAFKKRIYTKKLQEKAAKRSKRVLKESKKLTEAPIYDLNPQYDNRQSFYGKAKVDTGDKNDQNKLYSYNTLVAEIKNGKPVVYGTYSQTTLRHIKDWLKQNGFKAENSKQILNDYGVNESCESKVNEDAVLDTGRAETSRVGKFDDTTTFEQWYDITKGENEKYRKSKYYPFKKYIKVFPEAAVLKDATAADIVAHAHEFYDYYDVDSADREEAFNFACDVTGRDYDDFYNAWRTRTSVGESLEKLTEATTNNVQTETIMKSDDGLFEFVKRSGTKKGEDDEEIPWVHFDVYSKGAAEKHVVRIALSVYGSNYDDPWYDYVEVSHGMRMRRDTFEDTEEYIKVLTSALKFARQIEQYLRDNGRMKKIRESRKSPKGKKLKEGKKLVEDEEKVIVHELPDDSYGQDYWYWYIDNDGFYGEDGKNGLIILDDRGGIYKQWTQFSDNQLLDAISENSLSELIGKEYDNFNSGDFECYYPESEFSSAELSELADIAEGQFTVYKVLDADEKGYDTLIADTVITTWHGPGTEEEQIAKTLGVSPDQIVIKKPKHTWTWESKKSNKGKKLKEEVSDLAYDMAEEIDKRFASEKFISWDDFNAAFEDAYPGVIDWTDDKFNDLETDVRGILGHLGWETIFEGEDEGGLRMLHESRKPSQKRPLKESKGDLQKLPQEVQDIVGEVFDYTMDFDFLDVVADVLLRIDDFEEAVDNDGIVLDTVDDTLIYIDDQWEVLRYYFDSPSDLDSESWDTAFTNFASDIERVCAEVVADKQIKADYAETQEESLKKSGKKVTEAIENATIETEDQVIKVSSEEKEEDMNADWYDRESMGEGELLSDDAGDEMIVPLSDEDMEEIEEPAEEETKEETTEDDFVVTDEEEMPEDEDEFDFEEVQEESFNRLVGKYLTNTYKNIKSYKVTGKDIKEGLVKIDGEIEFKSGNKRNTTFVFEAKRDKSSISRKKMRFVGLNETFTDKRNAYVLNAKKVGKQMVAESLRYNYPAKAKNLNENLKVVKGLVK